MGLNEVLSASEESCFTIPASFNLEKGAYGGVVLAIVTHRVSAVASFPIRSLQMNFSALARPDVDTRCEVKLMRRGSKTETLSFSVHQGDACVAHGSAFTGIARNTALPGLYVARPSVPAASEVAPLGSTLPLPPFTEHFVMRPCIGGMIFSGSSPTTGGYLNFCDPSISSLGAPQIAALIDAWWPSFAVHETQMRPMGTTSMQINFLVDEPLNASEPVLLDIRGQAMAGGFGSETNYLWGPGGQLLACAQQCIAVIA